MKGGQRRGFWLGGSPDEGGSCTVITDLRQRASRCRGGSVGICRCSRRAYQGGEQQQGFLAGGWEEPESAWQWREDPCRDRQSGWYL
ncbi:unnamed protein product [Ectocarpus sp. 8 AP-2014]